MINLSGHNPNTITFDSNTNSHWEQDLATAILLLCRNGYTVQTYYEDGGVWVLRYDYVNHHMATLICTWIDPDSQVVQDVD